MGESAFSVPRTTVKENARLHTWSERLGSNQRPRGPEPRALPTELRPDYSILRRTKVSYKLLQIFQ